MVKVRSNFIYKAGQVNGIKMILIVDQDSGGMSVTNDIENVVAFIGEKEGIDPDEYFIAYKDSDGNWDGWDPINKEFYFFRKNQAWIDAGMSQLKYK